MFNIPFFIISIFFVYLFNLQDAIAAKSVLVNPPVILKLVTGGTAEVSEFNFDYDQNDTPIIVYKDSSNTESFIDLTNIDNIAYFNDIVKESSLKYHDVAKLINNLSVVKKDTDKGCYTNSGYVFGTTEESFERGQQMAFNHDTLAFARLAAKGMVGVTKPGVKVFLEDVGIFSGKRKVRPEGAVSSIWISSDAINCK